MNKNDIISNFTLTPMLPPCLAMSADTFRRMRSLEAALLLASSRVSLQAMLSGPAGMGHRTLIETDTDGCTSPLHKPWYLHNLLDHG